MKRTLSIIYLIVTLIFLVGCQQELSPKDKLLRQYDQYIQHDIRDEHIFDDFINDVSNFTIPGTVVIRTTARDAFNLVREVKEGSGFIYAIYDNSLRVVTSLDAVSVTNTSWTVTVEIIDYANRAYSALVLNRSTDYNLAKIKFDTNVAVSRLRKIDLSSYDPLMLEPIMMISNYQKSRNSMYMGLLIEKNEEEGIYITSIPADEFTIGGTVIDMRRRVIGMVIAVEDGKAQVINLEQLKAYLGIL